MEKTLHVLGLSGGKDSAALSMYMRDNYPELDIQYYFTDTGKELPEVIDFVNRLEGYVGKIVDPYEEVFTSNREKKDFDYHLRQHKNYLPSPQARWCTIQMKLVPFEKWIQMKMEKEGYTKVVSYVGIRADEPAREGFLTNTVTSEYLTIRMPFREDGLERDDIFEILRKADLLGDDFEVKAFRDLFLDPKTYEPIEPKESDYRALSERLLSDRLEIKNQLFPAINLLEVLHFKNTLVKTSQEYKDSIEKNHFKYLLDTDVYLNDIDFNQLDSEWFYLVEHKICRKEFPEFQYSPSNLLVLKDKLASSNKEIDKQFEKILDSHELARRIENIITILRTKLNKSDVQYFLNTESLSSILDNKELDIYTKKVNESLESARENLEKFYHYSYLDILLEELKSFLDTQTITFENLIKMLKLSSHFEANLTAEILLDILKAKDEGKPGYYGWRSRSGCTFCFYQQKIEWLRLKEIYPQAFEEAKSYEKKAEEDRGNGTFYWLGKGTPLSSLESETRKVEIIENHELRVKRLEKKLNRRANLLRANVKVSDTERMDEIYDEVEGGGACVTCYK